MLLLDSEILLLIQNYVRNPVFDPIMFFFSVIGNAGALWLITAAALCCTKKYRRAGVTMLVCIALCFVVNNLVLKNLIQRPRPFSGDVPGLLAYTGRFSDASSWSFPSGHACSSFAAAFSLTYSFKKGALFYIPATLIAFSRCYIGVHYPSDVICGALIGTLGAFIVCLIIRKVRPLHKR